MCMYEGFLARSYDCGTRWLVVVLPIYTATWHRLMSDFFYNERGRWMSERPTQNQLHLVCTHVCISIRSLVGCWLMRKNGTFKCSPFLLPVLGVNYNFLFCVSGTGTNDGLSNCPVHCWCPNDFYRHILLRILVMLQHCIWFHGFPLRSS